MIEDFGPRVTNAWNDLRSATRNLLERAWATPVAGAGPQVARSPNVVVRALAQEALAQMPAPLLIMLLHDPVDAGIARYALHRQASEYNSEEARQALQELDDFGLEQFLIAPLK